MMTIMANASFSPPETIYIAGDTAACDGGGGPLGHPRIYMSVDSDTHEAVCGYCDRLFIKDPQKAGGKAHAAH